jgi:hypothetical protein
MRGLQVAQSGCRRFLFHRLKEEPPGRLPPPFSHSQVVGATASRNLVSECLELKNYWKKCRNERKSSTWPGKQRQSHLKEVALFLGETRHRAIHFPWRQHYDTMTILRIMNYRRCKAIQYPDDRVTLLSTKRAVSTSITALLADVTTNW